MAIEIKLTGFDATDYLDSNGPDVEALKNSLKTAMEYIDVLERAAKVEEVHTNLDDPKRHNISGSMNQPAQHQAATAKVVRDTAIAKEIDTTFHTGEPNTKWTKEELKLIYWCMDRPEGELNRRLDVLVTKLTRTESAIRAKLNELEINVTNGVMFYK